MEINRIIDGISRRRSTTSCFFFVCAMAVLGLMAAQAYAQEAPTEIIRIWPGPAPGTEDWDVTEVGTPRTVTNVAIPTLTVFRAAPDVATGAAMNVCPGGGFTGLAFSHEGVLVAEWLAARGVTALVLKYRVRMDAGAAQAREDRQDFDQRLRALESRRAIAVADGIQAMRYVRANASYFAIDAEQIGMMGFSAGAATTMGVVMEAPPGDRPNFAAPIYGSMAAAPAPAHGPALFVATARDDPVIPAQKSIEIYTAWALLGLPAELHIYETGGHGFGMLRRGTASDRWPADFEAWLEAHGWARSTQ